MTANTTAHITADDLYRLDVVSDVALSPDGMHVLFTRQRVDRKTEKKYSNIWVVATDGQTPPRQFTYGDYNDTSPKWSPDGQQIAFISNRQDETQPQLYLIPFRGGEARPLTALKGDFDEFAWSPQGDKLAFIFRQKDQAELEREEDEAKKKLGVVDRHITRVFFKLDGAGYLSQAQSHLWVLDLETGEPMQLTEGEIHSEHAPGWSPDGQEIVFVSNRTDEPALHPDADDLYIIPASGGDFRKLDLPIGNKLLPTYSPDGQWIAYISSEGDAEWWRNERLLIVPADGSGPRRNLTEAYDFEVSHWTLTDTGSTTHTPPTWSPDSQTLYFQVAEHGRTTLKSINIDGSQLTDVINDEGVVAGFSFDQSRTKLAYFWASLRDPGQIWLRNLDSSPDRQLTQFNAFLDDLDLGTVEEVWIKGPADNDLQGWILKPPGFDPDRQYPSILEIHGGPLTQYGFFFMHEFYTLAAQGYVVHFSNPRGGKGYGEAHAKAIWNDWGGADYDDVMAWTDYMAGLFYIDPARMGITGGSYGGFMTVWAIGHTDRFRAAVAQRVVSNLISMFGSSDFNWQFQQEFGNRPPWENMENYWRMSPMKYIGNAKTPTLVIHSENDFRCAIEQGEQVFVALKYLGVDTEFIRFPEESHGLSRGGRTDRRIVRLNHISGWFDRYLKQ